MAVSVPVAVESLLDGVLTNDLGHDKDELASRTPHYHYLLTGLIVRLADGLKSGIPDSNELASYFQRDGAAWCSILQWQHLESDVRSALEALSTPLEVTSPGAWPYH